MRLAKQHVPAFTFGDTRRLGRPAKLKNMLLVRYPKHPTRGRKPDAERRKYLRELLRRVLADMLRQNIKGRGSIKTVLINRCTEELKAAKLSGTTRLPAMVRKDQKDVSEAKKLFPEIAAKFPK